MATQVLPSQRQYYDRADYIETVGNGTLRSAHAKSSNPATKSVDNLSSAGPRTSYYRARSASIASMM